MSVKEWKRLEAVERIERGELTVNRAGELLGLSARQVRRIRKAVQRSGSKGVIHGSRGRRARNRIAESLRGRMVKLRRGKYAGFNDQHFQEKLAEVEGLVVSRASVRRVLPGGGGNRSGAQTQAAAPPPAARAQDARRADDHLGRQSPPLAGRARSAVVPARGDR